MTKRQMDPETSTSTGDYLKAVYAIESLGGPATTGALAERLAVAPASVTGMLQRLAGRKPALVVYEKHRGAVLTDEGRKRALEVLRRHRLIELFLHEVLGFAWDEVHEEAEALEHVISEHLGDRIAERLGNPTVDPHGDPIPAKDGTLPEPEGEPLTRTRPGTLGVVHRVSGASDEMLRYLGGLGIRPGARIRVKGRAPFDGPVTVRVEEGPECALGRKLAAKVFVRSADSS